MRPCIGGGVTAAAVSGGGGPSLVFEELWTGTNGDAWNATRWPEITKSSSSIVDIQSNQGRMLTVTNIYGWCRAMASVSPPNDIEITYKLTRANTGEQYHMAHFRRGAAWNVERPTNGYSVWMRDVGGGVTSLSLRRHVNSDTTVLGDVAKTWGTSQWNFRIQAIGSAIKAKAWQGTEPGSWDIEVTDATHASGGVSLSTSGNELGTSRTALFDDLQVYQL